MQSTKIHNVPFLLVIQLLFTKLVASLKLIKEKLILYAFPPE